MECIQYLNSFAEVHTLVKKIQEKRIPATLGLEPYRLEHYRGQVSESFKLLPSLSRCFKDIGELENVEREMMAEFKIEMQKNNKLDALLLHDHPNAYQNEWAWLGQAQHYRLPTRMLDWSLRWEVALYFAVEDNKTFNSDDGQFWVFYVPVELLMHEGKKDLYYERDPYKLGEPLFINPSFFWTEKHEQEHAEIRRTRQHGRFSIQSRTGVLISLEEEPTMSPNLEKYCIPKDAKGQIRLELAANGIFGDFLYANEDGKINDIISKLREKYRVK